jgi:taurine---2-oxoglutarate transaminase
MTTTVATAPMTGQEIVDLTKKHTLFEWSAQSKVDPIPVARAKGIYFWTPGREALYRFQQSVDVGEHRTRRRARHQRDP